MFKKNEITMQTSTIAKLKPKQYGKLNASYEERKTWYLLPRWKVHRLEYLKFNPNCTRCHKKGVLEPAVIVDHVNGHIIGTDDEGNTWKDYFWTGPFEGMCWSHHSQKTCLEDQKRKPKRLTAAQRRKMMVKLTQEFDF